MRNWQIVKACIYEKAWDQAINDKGFDFPAGCYPPLTPLIAVCAQYTYADQMRLATFWIVR